VIWCKKYNFLKSFFESSTGETLREGLKVLVRVRVEYHELYGLSLNICDIDPSFTVGDLAVRRQQIIRKLEEEGVFSMNRELELPVPVQRIAVISSSNAAGFTDFMNHLLENSYGYVFYTKLYESPMQGSETEQGIVSALDRISRHAHLFDIAVIIRGGGSQTDLSWFDNYRIAYHITQFPLPVLTGIGHDKDMSVTDMVANTALKTPTAVADFLVENMAATEGRLYDLGMNIREKAQAILDRSRHMIESCGVRLFPLSAMMISRMKEVLTRTETSVRSESAKLVRSGTSSVDNLERALVILSPENVLKRGYTLTLKNGMIVKGSSELSTGDIILTKFNDGDVESLVTSGREEKFEQQKLEL
jgi:exodeoxyribonuclease VII large subunit